MMKQRLIGAAVLIALGVIFIPMLLNGDGKFFSGKVESNIPPKPMYELEAPRVLPLDKRSGKAGEPVAEAAPKADQATGDAPAMEVASNADQAKIASDGEGKTVAEPKPKNEAPLKIPAPASEKLQVKEPAAKEEVKEKAASQTTVAKVATPEKSQAVSKQVEKAAAEPVTKKPIVTGWVVQLGSFSVQKNALKLRDSLRKNGHASFVEEYARNGKKSYRVRVGPEQTRDLANELKKKLKAETKLDGFVIEFPGK